MTTYVGPAAKQAGANLCLGRYPRILHGGMRQVVTHQRRTGMARTRGKVKYMVNIPPRLWGECVCVYVSVLKGFPANPLPTPFIQISNSCVC